MDMTIEPLDLCLRKEIVDEEQHAYGMRFRWLYTYWLLVLMCLTDWLRINLFWFAGVASKIKNFIEIKDSKAYLQCFVHRLWLAKDRSRRAI
jgi:hypothetical protein